MTAFVILHYQNIDVTKECVNYLQRLKEGENAAIIIVDNASTNGTGNELQELYRETKNIKVIITKDNLGFAGGNNVGYDVARNEYQADRIIVINSDLFIKDSDFLLKLNEIELNHPEDSIIAPDILSMYGVHQNPFKYQKISSRKQRKIILKKRAGQLIYSLPIVGSIIISRKPMSSTSHANKKDTEEKYDIIPHGACLIFMKPWVVREKQAFQAGTFLFCEEEILFDYCQYRKHLIHYVPSLEVFHMEDASQNAVSATLLQKKKKQLKYEIQSRKVLLQYRKKYQRESETI